VHLDELRHEFGAKPSRSNCDRGRANDSDGDNCLAIHNGVR
jgi:hypothetical protein